ncbi:HNH endonuclease signature motif containing protein [Microbispora sp. NPDC046933]|uniref:HNH endonuclease n=1 Tax=Microbispora sp. NPDC046933 TaxID=3155618 RepID=UPI00340F27F7
MAISERTRKILWIEAGGRCAICRRQLLTAGTETDDPSVFGEEAHIVGRGSNGPRSGGLAEHLVDSHENLILLCSEHHKQIDDQVNHFTVERLREIKKSHKGWISSLGASGPGPVKLVPDPSFAEPRTLKLFLRGKELWSIIKDCQAFEYTIPDGLSEEEEDSILGFLDLVRDYMDISGDLHSIREQRDAEKTIGNYLKDLLDQGFLVGGFLRRMLLAGGISEEPWPWSILRIEVQPAELAQIVDAEGKPFNPPSDLKHAADQKSD